VKCEDVRNRLEEFRSGELGAGISGLLSEHLSACASCSDELAALAREEELYRSYGERLHAELETGPGMWQGIRDSISPARETRPMVRKSFLQNLERLFPAPRFARYAAFAALVACASIAGTLLAVKMLKPEPQAVAGGAANPAQNGLEAALQSVQRAETEYVQAIGLLSDIVDRQKQMLDPTRRAELEKHLKSLDEEILRARQAYRAHPLDAELGIYMLTAYREKVELLQELATS
jgi:hypothetical protein